MNNREYKDKDSDWYPAAEMARLLGRKWVVPVLYTLIQDDGATFNDLSRRVGINPKSQSEVLTKMSENNLISRIPAESTQEVRYELTEKGENMKKVIDLMEEHHG